MPPPCAHPPLSEAFPDTRMNSGYYSQTYIPRATPSQPYSWLLQRHFLSSEPPSCLLRTFFQSGNNVGRGEGSASVLLRQCADACGPVCDPVRTGIPPRPLDISTGDQTSLEELGIRSGDVIVVQEGQGHAIPPSSSSGQSAVQSHATTVGPSPLSTNSAATASKPSSMADTPKAHSAQATPRVTASSDGLLQPVPLRPVAKNTSNLTSSPSKSEIAAAQPARNSRPQQPQSPPFSGATASGAKPGLTSIEGASIKVDGKGRMLSRARRVGPSG